MFSRLAILLSLAALLAPLAHAKDKNKVQLPQLVLNAETVYVVVNPGSEVPLMNPGENRGAEHDVENALQKWGRFQLVFDPQVADLVISVRRGRGVSPTIGGVPNNGPVLVPGTNDGDVRMGGSIGRPPDVSEPMPGAPTGPRPGMEVGPSEDTFEVYRGHVDYPLDSAPLWRYSEKDALRAPMVPAVKEFQKAIEKAEKQLANAKKKGP